MLACPLLKNAAQHSYLTKPTAQSNSGERANSTAEQTDQTKIDGVMNPVRYRFNHAPHLFLGAFVQSPSASGKAKGRRLIGHICSTQSSLTYYTKESMSVHVPFSPSICIHSVCLLESYRRKGIGLKMMQEYLARVQQYCSTEEVLSRGKPNRVLLVTHDEVRPFYEQAGFVCKGRSDVVLGKGVWYEMSLEIRVD